jgi:tripartite-type tricarboxylate transporter receptor subunit TctC
MFFNNAFGMKFRVIKGYKGTRDILLALERGEVMGICASHDPLTRRSQFKEGKLRILLQAAMKKDPSIDAPLPTKYLKDESQRKALALFLARRDLGRPFLAPPGVPKERVQALRRAFDATMKDKAFLAQAKKRRFAIDPTTGEELTKIIADLYATPKEAVRLTAKALGRKVK